MSKGLEALEELLYYANLNFERENERKTEFTNKIEKIGIADNEENFKIIEKDLEVLEQLEILKKYYPPFREFLEEMFEKGYNEDLTKIKEWLEND